LFARLVGDHAQERRDGDDGRGFHALDHFQDEQRGRGADAHDGAPAFTFDRKPFPRLLNPTGTETTQYYAGSGDGCRKAKTLHPEQVPDLAGAEVVPCPDALRDPAWNACPFGSLFASSDSKKCACVTGGPSPRATDVPCPEPIK